MPARRFAILIAAVLAAAALTVGLAFALLPEGGAGPVALALLALAALAGRAVLGRSR